MCFHSLKAKKRVEGYMEVKLFEKIIEEVKDYIFRVSLHHRGEALMHRDLARMIAIANRAGVRTNIHTNATLLTEKLSRELLESGLDELHFSFDGEDKETFEKTRRGANYEKTLQNIMNFLKLKKKYNCSTPRVEIQVLKPHTSVNQSAEKIEKLFRGLPVNAFTTGILINWGGNYKNEAKANIVAPRSDYAPCNTIWSDAIIGWDGTVLPCCRDYDNDYILGNVHDEPLYKIWNNEKMQSLRKMLVEKRYEDLDLCRHCDVLWTLKYEYSLPKKILAQLIRALEPAASAT
jgi:radical SAM protein with 4Fe4S-binding SPASM domain